MVRRVLIDGLTIKAALCLGFGLTLGLWLLAAYDFTRRMAQIEREGAAISARYLHAQELLATVQPRVLLTSVLVRDALLDPNPSSLREYRRRVERTLTTVDETLRQYVPILDSADERERVERLRGEIREFGGAMAQVLARDAARSAADARVLLGRIAPRREIVIGVSEQVRRLNRAAFVQQQAAIAETHRVNQRRVWQQLGFSVAASLGIAVFAALYAGRLETRLRRQREKDARMARDLQRLSGKLIHAQEEERRTIARELHDEVGQVLMAIKVELALAQRRLEASTESARLLDEAQSITDAALHSVRDLSHLLHPALLDDLGLIAALDWYVQGYGRRHGIRVELRHDLAQERLAAPVEIAAYRIVQEALTNVAKHATATSCVVSVRRGPASIAITVEDDGVGFDPAAAGQDGPRAGLGLIGIRERASQLGGSVHLTSRVGRGTVVSVELPVTPAAVSGDEHQAASAAVQGDPRSETPGG